jgi:hypothetical protein
MYPYTYPKRKREQLMKTALKVNVVSLASESQYIRRQELKIKRMSPLKGADPECQKLIQHRRWDLRNESRAAQLVYAFARKVPYSAVEKRRHEDYYRWSDVMKRAERKCGKFGLRYEAMVSWINATPAEIIYEDTKPLGKRA